MGIPDGIANPDAKFNTDNFAAANNTVVLAKLLLLGPNELNELLYDHHVGAIYGRPGFPDNAMLGFIRTLDGNHQWRNHSPASAAEGPQQYSNNGGMLIWRDCLARKRVFRVIFEDWQNDGENFPPLGEDCEEISEKLLPVEFIITPEQEALIEPLCTAPLFDVKLINHREVEQPFAFYVRVVNPDGETVFHRVISGVLDRFETQNLKTDLHLGCNGTYTADFYLFERMWSLELDDELANPPIQPRPGPDEYLPLEVNSHQVRSFT
jgi:hypothetical protein